MEGTEVYRREERKAQCWAWTSLVVGALVFAGALVASSWPVALVEVGSVVGPALFIFGGTNARSAGIVVLVITTVFELVAGGVLLVVGLIFVASHSTLGGFGPLIGTYAFVLSVPVLGVGIVDAITAKAMRDVRDMNDSRTTVRSAEPSRPDIEMSTPFVNLEMSRLAGHV